MHDKHKPHGEGIDRKLHDPVSDKLVPLTSLDLTKVHSVDDLVRAMGNTAFTGRQVGEGADVLGGDGTRQGMFRCDDACRSNDCR